MTNPVDNPVYKALIDPNTPLSFTTPSPGIGNGQSSFQANANQPAEPNLISKIINFFWDSINQVIDTFWGMKATMQMTEVNEAELDAPLVAEAPTATVSVPAVPLELPILVPTPIPVPELITPRAIAPNPIPLPLPPATPIVQPLEPPAVQLQAVEPIDSYNDKEMDKIAEALEKAKEEVSSHPAMHKLVHLRGAVYKSLHEQTQTKLMRLIQQQLNNPNLKTLKECLLNDPFWILFSNSVERAYLKFAIQRLERLYKMTTARQVPIRAREMQADFLTLTSKDCYAISALGPKSWIAKYAFNSTFDEAEKQKALELLTRYTESQKQEFDKINHFIEI